MTALRTTTKARFGFKGAKAAAKHPRATRRGGRSAFLALRKVGAPVSKRRARHRAEELSDTVRSVGQTIATYVPPLAREVSTLVEPPPRKRTTPRIAAGFVLGAGTMYLLEPDQGAAHRAKIRELVAG